MFQWLGQKKVSIRSFIFIGRRSNYQDNDFRHLWNNENITIHSYDTILDICQNVDYDNIKVYADLEIRETIKHLREKNYVPEKGIKDLLK